MFGVLGFGVYGLGCRAEGLGPVIVHSCFVVKGGYGKQSGRCYIMLDRGSERIVGIRTIPPGLSQELRGTMQWCLRIGEFCIVSGAWGLLLAVSPRTYMV